MASESKRNSQDFNNVRNFIRSLFIYGYKQTNELSEKLGKRSNNEYLSRIKKLLSKYLDSYTLSDNKTSINYISVDSHKIESNPFYLLLKSSTFTDNQIALHFNLTHILIDGKEPPYHNEPLNRNDILIYELPKTDNYIFENGESEKVVDGKENVEGEKDGDGKKNGEGDGKKNSEDEKDVLQELVANKLLVHNEKDNTYSFGKLPLFIRLNDSGDVTISIQELLDRPAFTALLGATKAEMTKSLMSSAAVTLENGICSFKNVTISIEQLVGKKHYTDEQIQNIIESCASHIFSASRATTDILEETLKEYNRIGIVKTGKVKNTNTYSLTKGLPLNNDSYDDDVCTDRNPAKENIMNDEMREAVQFFSETNPLGFFGSTLLDLQDDDLPSPFIFKHHYLANALNTEILYHITYALEQQLLVQINLFNSIKFTKTTSSKLVVPIKLFRSVESGRIYLFAYSCQKQGYAFYLLDDIESVDIEFPRPPQEELLGSVACQYKVIEKPSTSAKANKKEQKTKELICTNYADLAQDCEKFSRHIWSMSIPGNASNKVYKVVIRFHVDESEHHYILGRLEREKRQGELRRIDTNTYEYTVELFNPGGMFPWLRSYITRIEYLSFSNQETEDKFWGDFDCMAAMYGVDKEEQ